MEIGLESVYIWLTDNIYLWSLLMSDQLNQVSLLMQPFDISAQLSPVLGTVYGFIQLGLDASSLFPDSFGSTLLFLIATFFISILLNFIITIWKLIPFV